MPNQYTDPIPVEERFWSKVDRSGGPGACWLWTAGLDDKGYGRFTGSKPFMLAHRVSWEMRHGPIPDELCVLHNCPGGDNPRCVNPGHLWLGTQLDNVADRDMKGRTARGERSGSYTHPERRPSGERHGSRTKPERLARGDQNGARLHPERLPRGDQHWLRRNPGIRRGEANQAAILTWEKVRAIRAAYAAGGISYTDLARAYDVTKGTIAHIVQGRNWRE